ncbi:MAG: cupin domain-containing protein [Ruminococcus sp.]|nr:cupin domain-containing protein [Ruminococcus sp.]
MNRTIEFKSLQDTIHVKKDNGTEVNYYIFQEYEIHLNKIAPHSIQEWHYHTKIEETILITKGVLNCRYLVNGEECHQLLKAGDMVRVKDSIHTFSNDTEEDVEFVVFRFVPTGEDKRELIKNDKCVVENRETLQK